MSIPSKQVRLEEIWRRLRLAPACRSHAEALGLLVRIINQVEDELTDIPPDLGRWQTDGRIYPPQEDQVRDIMGRKDLLRYRSRRHNTLIRNNGAIEIRTLTGEVVFSKPGADGFGVEFETER